MLAQSPSARPVRVTVDAYPGEVFAGAINALNPKVDDATRNIQVQATLPNPDGRLRPGHVRRRRRAAARHGTGRHLPHTAIVYNPYGNAVYVVGEPRATDGGELVVRQQFVQLGETRGDQVAVVKGVKPGDDVVTAGQLKLRNGAASCSQQRGQPPDDSAPPPPEHPEPRMNFTDIFIKRPVLATVVSLLILLIGFRSIELLNVRQYPVSNSAVVTVTTVYTGASADLIQGFITTPLEKQIASADGIDYIESSSAPSVSTITVHLLLNYDPNAALAQIISKIDKVRNQLPAGALDPDDRRAGGRDDGRDVPELLQRRSWTATRSPTTSRASCSPSSPPVSGVQSAQIIGGRIFAMRIWLKPDKLAAYGLSPSQVRQALAANNFSGGGRRDQGRADLGQPQRRHRPAHGRRVPAAGHQAAERRHHPPGRRRRRGPRRGELRQRGAVRRQDRHVHRHQRPADRQFARRDRRRPEGVSARSSPSCPRGVYG